MLLRKRAEVPDLKYNIAYIFGVRVAKLATQGYANKSGFIFISF